MGLHTRAQAIYDSGELKLAAEDIPDTSAVEAAFNKAVKWLHGERVFSTDMLKEAPVKELIEATTGYLARGIERGIEQSEPTELMKAQLRQSAGIFSGFKTFHEMKEAAGMLIDENGNIKPFERFYNDVQKLNNTYNRNYLRTEYDFAVISSERAARWEEQQDDGGGRYMLQYRTMGDEKVRASHRKLNGVTLPASDPFWDEFYPPNGWGCRCLVAKVRAAKYPKTDSTEARARGEEAVEGKYSKMFRFNPGKDKAVFPAYNSYTISKCSTCQQNGYKLARIPNNELCAACVHIRQMMESEQQRRLTREERLSIREAAKDWAEKNLTEVVLESGMTAKRLYITVADNGDTLVLNKGTFEETFAKNKNSSRLAETMELLTKSTEWMPKAHFIRQEEGIHHDFSFDVYEATVGEVTVEFKVKSVTEKILYNLRIKKEE